MKTRLFILSLMAAVFTLMKAGEKPNLLIIHTDEHSFRTLSCYQEIMPEDQAFVWGKGNNVETPNIDRIAHEGAIATSYYCSSPVCTPSRASLITGLYPQATGAWKNGLHIREDVTTFAHVLKDAGYATSYVGKWHLAGHEKYAFGIEYKAGFDDNRYMMKGGHAPYFHLINGEAENKVGLGANAAEKYPQEEIIHLTDYFTEKTLEILERDKDKAFCLMLSIPDPHTPDYATSPYNTMYNDMDVQMPMTMQAKYVVNKPGWAKGSKDDKNEAQVFSAKSLQQYFGMVKHIDDRVGDILAYLDDNNLTENTIVIFTADHGDMFYEHARRNKGVPYEASAKIPFVIRYPKKIKAGKVLNTAYTNVDFAPTILSMMGIDYNVGFHGEDTSDDYLNKDMEVNSDRITYYAKSGGWWVAAVSDRYKLVLDKKEKPYLFDMEKDPFELTNVYDDQAYAKIAKEMQAELFRQMKKYDEPGLSPKAKPYITE